MAERMTSFKLADARDRACKGEATREDMANLADWVWEMIEKAAAAGLRPDSQTGLGDRFPDTLVIDAPEGWGLHCRGCCRTLIASSDGGLELNLINRIAERHTCAAKESA